MSYQERTYRNRVSQNSLTAFNLRVSETDLLIHCDTDLSHKALESVYSYRGFIEFYISTHPDFLTSLAPVDDDALAPAIIRDMLKASLAANVGPMAAVAGAISEYVANDLIAMSQNVIVENGGDIYLKTEQEVSVGIFAGNSPLTYKIGLLLKPEQMPIGVCTSSGTVGHSLSFGKADAVCVLSRSSTMADAAATAIGNLVKGKGDIRTALEKGMQIEGVLGTMIVIGDHFGVMGDIELI
jgi:ApbE superfamily uncharacterized protein (UPF0280 family)